MADNHDKCVILSRKRLACDLNLELDFSRVVGFRIAHIVYKVNFHLNR